MKRFFAVLMISLLSFAAHAASAHPHAVLCSLNAEEDPGLLLETEKLDIDDLTSLPAPVLALVNDNLIKQGYTDQELSFDEIKALFGDNGARRYDDLYITTREAMATGTKYLEIRSFPGDNAYGTIYVQGGIAVAEVADGDIYLITGSDTQYCEYE